MSSYFVAFSNDTRDWTTLHDGYAEWVSSGEKRKASHSSRNFLSFTLSNCPFQLFYGNVDKNTPVKNQFFMPIVARYLRILPQSWNGSLCLRAEVMACPLPSQSRRKRPVPLTFGSKCITSSSSSRQLPQRE